MADIKVKLIFDDEDNTTFEYDRISGLKSLSLNTEAKVDTNIDYSVKSNSGQIDAIDLNRPSGYIDNIMKDWVYKELNSSNLSNNFSNGGIFYNSSDEYFYLSNHNFNKYSIYKTKDFNLFESITNNAGTTALDNIILFDNTIVATGKINANNETKYGYIYLDSSNNIVNKQFGDMFTGDYSPNGQQYTPCLKIANNKLFMCIGDYYEFKYGYLDSADGEFHEINIPFPYSMSQHRYLYDVIYYSGKYIFLTRYGILTSTDLINFNLEKELIQDSGYYNGSIIIIGSTYFITYKGYIYRGKDFNNLVKTTLQAEKIYKFDDIYILETQDLDNLYYTSDFNNEYKISMSFSTQSFNSPNISTHLSYDGKNFRLLSSDIFSNYSYLVSSPDITKKLHMYNSLYDFLLKKVSYNNIYCYVNLDGNILMNMINNGKINYDVDTKQFILQLQSPLTLLQGNKYKKQIDKDNIDNGFSAFDLITEITNLSTIIINQEFYIDDITKEYMKSVIIKYPYLEEDTIWNQLDKLCVLCQLSIYPANNKIIIERWV